MRSQIVRVVLQSIQASQALDWLPGIKYWVRNLDSGQNAAFWRPTSTDRFYPDFVALLEDGRLLVAEYKGGLTAQTKDTEEKRTIGELWESKSGGKGLFMIVEKKDQLGRGMLEQLKVKTGK